MKNAVKIGLFLFFILVVVRSSNAQYSLSGIVKYSDNSGTVTTGVVKAYLPDGSLAATTNILPNGTYTFASLITNQYDIIGFPNVEPEDNFVPTYYPDAINPSIDTRITPTSNMTNVDISVSRIGVSGHMAFSTSVSGNVNFNNKSAENAIIYLQKDDAFFGYAITDSRGNYKLNSIPPGDYIIAVYKLGNLSAAGKVTVTTKEVTNLDFSLTASANKNEIILNTTPSKFSLSQNYPNPFNPGTVISYNIPANGTVSLVVYNSLGKEVKTLVNGYQNAGVYSVNFNAGEISSGIYFYTLSVNDAVNSTKFTDTKRMVLIK